MNVDFRKVVALGLFVPHLCLGAVTVAFEEDGYYYVGGGPRLTEDGAVEGVFFSFRDYEGYRGMSADAPGEYVELSGLGECIAWAGEGMLDNVTVGLIDVWLSEDVEFFEAFALVDRDGPGLRAFLLDHWSELSDRGFAVRPDAALVGGPGGAGDPVVVAGVLESWRIARAVRACVVVGVSLLLGYALFLVFDGVRHDKVF